jgi:general secretion pathway protein A
MYEARFGLKRRPFSPMPDSSLYYPSTVHEEALAPILRAVRDDEGMAVLAGEPGTGKSLLGQILLERVPDCENAFLAHSQFADRRGMLQTILFDLGLPHDDDVSEQTLRLRLIDHALKTAASGKRLICVVDEAHHLTPDMLEELRLLGNLEAGRKAFQVVCLAQSPLLETLKQPKMASLNQRLAVRMVLPALTVDDSHDYLRHQIKVVGGRPEAVFDDEALDVLANGSRGVPRLLNQSAYQALLLADAGELKKVDAECASEALLRLGLDEAAQSSEAEAPDMTDAVVLDLPATLRKSA